MFIKNASVTIAVEGGAATTCSDEVQNVTSTPTQTPMVFAAISGKTIQETGNTTRALTFGIGQDWDNQASVANTLLENADKKGTITFHPRGTSGVGFKFNVTLAEPTIGGATGPAVSTVTLPVDGKPEPVPAPTPA